jgi:hypothetical protein
MWVSIFTSVWLMQPATPSCDDIRQAVDNIFSEDAEACFTGHLHALARQAQKQKQESCLEGALADRGFQAPWSATGNVESAPVVFQKDNHKEVENPFGGNPLLYETENFAIWYGQDNAFSDAHVETLGANFEHIWSIQIDTLLYPPPEFADDYKLNVFIGDTFSTLPSAEGNAGYFWYDNNGKPMMVLSKDIIAIPDSAKLTAAHEFFHAVQAAVGTYQFDNRALWYMEATANWILEEVFTDEGGYNNTLYSVAMRPEVSLNHYGDGFSNAIEESHQYGAFIFATYLSEHVGGTDLIRSTFEDAPVSGDPLLVISDLLSDYDSDMHQAHLDYAMRNATWDYRFESDYELAISDSAGLGETHKTSGQVDGLSEEWTSSIPYAPHTYGVNYWRLTDLPPQFYVEFEGTSDARFSVGLASQTGSEHTQLTVFHDGETVSQRIDDWEDAPQMWLVVAAIAGETDNGDTYPYQFRLRTIDAVEAENQSGGNGDDDEDDTGWGMGCSSQSSSSGMLLALILFAGIFTAVPYRRQTRRPI